VDKGVPRPKHWQQDYTAAKTLGDTEAAVRIIRGCVERSEHIIDAMLDDLTPFIERGTPLVCVVPHPSFDDDDGGDPDVATQLRPKNVIPITYANYIAEIVGAEVDTEILERERVGRTKLSAFERFLWQPSFVGEVRRDVAYVLVDDVITLGGTLAALRSYILMNDGTVALSTALAHKTGRGQLLALSSKTWDELRTAYGEELNAFWKEEIGHDLQCLTEAEGRVLVDWGREEHERSGTPLLQRLRARLFAAAAKNE
jgi:hypothetical protein